MARRERIDFARGANGTDGKEIAVGAFEVRSLQWRLSASWRC